MPTKTREEVEKLKSDWTRDPNWDLETTEGFGEYKDELISYRKACEANWDQQYQARISRMLSHDGIIGAIDGGHYDRALCSAIYMGTRMLARAVDPLEGIATSLDRIATSLENLEEHMGLLSETVGEYQLDGAPYHFIRIVDVDRE